MYNSIFKPLADRFFSMSLLLLLAPVFVIISLILFLDGHGVFFRQMRPGLNGQIFELLKFRTMKEGFDQDGRLLPDEKRITKVGKVLRTTSLDELPQLINVLRGEMSLIGPRPFLKEYLSLYSPKHAKRHQVRPGITGLAQVSGRNGLSWVERLGLDVEYVDNLSWKLDLTILLKTFGSILNFDNIGHKDHISMPKFRGYQTSQE